MSTLVRLSTHELTIHSQMASIETALNRPISFAITLNQKQSRSNIEFSLSEAEIGTLKQDLAMNVQVFNGTRWLPYL
jgi:hypothetical protein